MQGTNQQALIVIEGRATYERILAALVGAEQEEAIRQIQNFLKVYPEFAQAHNDLAVIFYRAGNALLALAHHEKAHKLEPLNLTFRKNLADFYAVELDWTDEAIHIYLDILKDNPFDVESLTALGTINERAGRREQARQYFTRAHQLDPLAADARNALHMLGDTTAVPQLPCSNEIDSGIGARPAEPAPPAFVPPPSPQALHGQAMAAAQSGRDQDAIALLEKLVTQHPGYAVAQNDLGVLYQRSGDLAQARRHHEEAVRLAPSDHAFGKNLADLLAVCFKEYEGALRIYVNLLAAAPRDIDLLRGVAYICTETGKVDDARTFLQRILAIEPWNREARDSLEGLPSQTVRSAADLHAEATRLAAENRLDEAKKLLEELVRLYPDEAVAYNDLGVIRYRLGEVEGSRQAYEQAVKLDPANGNFRKNLADLYFMEVGRVDDAIRIYLELLREQPRDVETLLTLGQIASAVGKPDEAKAFYRRALEIEPWNVHARDALNCHSASTTTIPVTT